MAASRKVGEPERLVAFAPPGALNPNHSLERWFRRSAAVLLAMTAAAKLLSATGDAHVLDLPDPLLGLPTRQVLVLIGSVECAIAFAAACLSSSKTADLLVLWLSANFLIYRASLAILSPGKICPCLGSVTEKLKLSPAVASDLLLGIALYLFLGSAICWFRGRTTSSPNAPSILGVSHPAEL